MATVVYFVFSHEDDKPQFEKNFDTEQEARNFIDEKCLEHYYECFNNGDFGPDGKYNDCTYLEYEAAYMKEVGYRIIPSYKIDPEGPYFDSYNKYVEALIVEMQFLEQEFTDKMHTIYGQQVIVEKN